jgi:magnesium transporter
VPDTADEQISLFVGDGFVITFQERAGDCFEAVRNRLRRGLREARA